MIEFITHPAFLWTVGILLFLGLSVWIASYFVASYIIYNSTLRKKNAQSWTREIPADVDPEQIPMYQIGEEWSRENAQYKNDVHIVRDGLNLYGEYYDLGSDRCVLVLSGRTECLKYGYYFAIPYAKSGYNVLVVDPRGHGLSDGEINTVGFEESRDAIEWIKFIKQTYHINHFVLHGICIGAAGGMLALHSPECPEGIDGIVTEGMFPNFAESVKNHLIEKKRPVRFTVGLVDMWMKHYTGHSMRFGPLNVISEVKTPLLMLHSREDLYSTPEYAQILFDRSGATMKKLVWFEHGRHSMLRITDTELYDTSIQEFLKQIAPHEQP